MKQDATSVWTRRNIVCGKVGARVPSFRLNTSQTVGLTAIALVPQHHCIALCRHSRLRMLYLRRVEEQLRQMNRVSVSKSYE
jgi:hypothetical protein